MGVLAGMSLCIVMTVREYLVWSGLSVLAGLVEAASSKLKNVKSLKGFPDLIQARLLPAIFAARNCSAMLGWVRSGQVRTC